MVRGVVRAGGTPSRAEGAPAAAAARQRPPRACPETETPGRALRTPAWPACWAGWRAAGRAWGRGLCEREGGVSRRHTRLPTPPPPTFNKTQLTIHRRAGARRVPAAWGSGRGLWREGWSEVRRPVGSGGLRPCARALPPPPRRPPLPRPHCRHITGTCDHACMRCPRPRPRPPPRRAWGEPSARGALG